MFKKVFFSLVGATFAVAGLANSASAVDVVVDIDDFLFGDEDYLGETNSPFVEVGDAGETLDTAQIVGGGFDGITGFLDPDTADLFKFTWGGGLFSATTDTSGSDRFDTQLFLFDSSGIVIDYNDDDGSSYWLFSNITDVALSAGDYFLGISEFPNAPLDANGDDARGSGSPLAGFEGYGDDGGTYEIAFSGKTIASNAEAVPEPMAMVGLFVTAGLGAMTKKSKQQLADQESA